MKRISKHCQLCPGRKPLLWRSLPLQVSLAFIFLATETEARIRCSVSEGDECHRVGNEIETKRITFLRSIHIWRSSLGQVWISHSVLLPLLGYDGIQVLLRPAAPLGCRICISLQWGWLQSVWDVLVCCWSLLTPTHLLHCGWDFISRPGETFFPEKPHHQVSRWCGHRLCMPRPQRSIIASSSQLTPDWSMVRESYLFLHPKGDTQVCWLQSQIACWV